MTYQYTIYVSDPPKREIAIALLNALGCYAFEENNVALLAFTTDEIDKCAIGEVMEMTGATYSKSAIENVNWNQKWESEFQPVTILFPGSEKAFAHVRAHFHPPNQKACLDIIVTPKMSFGTGHHATTYGMMSYMSSIDFAGSAVVDFGTGTGILSILAEKMGALKILALDNDPSCILNARENLLLNGCSLVEVRKSDCFESLGPPDIILANINLNIIKENLSSIARASHQQTKILFSGILQTNEREMLQAMHDVGIKETDIVKKDGWLIIAAKGAGKLLL